MRSDLGRLAPWAPLWPLLIALAGVLTLPLSLFDEWFERYAHERSIRVTGWEAFAIADAFLVVFAAGGAIVVIRELLGHRHARDWWPLAWGAAAVVLLAVELLTQPNDLSGRTYFQRGPWLGLAGAGLMLIGGLTHLVCVRAQRAKCG